jgi:hypothetical protein
MYKRRYHCSQCYTNLFCITARLANAFENSARKWSDHKMQPSNHKRQQYVSRQVSIFGISVF